MESGTWQCVCVARCTEGAGRPQAEDSLLCHSGELLVAGRGSVVKDTRQCL